MTRITLLLLLTAGCAVRASTRSGAFGEAALGREHFDELDTAVARHVGAHVDVQAQRNVGAEAPQRSAPERLFFSGVLVGTTHEYLLLQSAPDDTARIGKTNVVGVFLRSADTGPSLGGMIVGAVVVGGSIAIVTRPGVPATRVSPEARFMLIPIGAVLGGWVGGMLGRAQRRGVRIYPTAPSAPAVPHP